MAARENFVTKRIAALVFIFGCTSLAWLVLGSTIFHRTFSSDEKLGSKVGSTWGTKQEQWPPFAVYTTVQQKRFQKEENGKTVTRTYEDKTDHVLAPDSSNIDVVLNLEHRQKGLLWYSTYAVKFGGDYVFQNPTDRDQLVTFKFKLPADKAVYDNLNIRINGQPMPSTMEAGMLAVQSRVAAHAVATMQVGYRSQGMDSWQYRLGADVAQARNLTLNMRTNFKDIDFAPNTLSPTTKRATANGWDLTWKYTNLLSGFQIGMTMPEKLQPGPLAGKISYFAPVSLLFFFFPDLHSHHDAWHRPAPDELLFPGGLVLCVSFAAGVSG
jgi:inner membrane protein involved in colicin E2 resistance